MTPGAYAAPAAQLLTCLHVVDGTGELTICGQPLDDPALLWQPVHLRDTDTVHPPCAGLPDLEPDGLF